MNHTRKPAHRPSIGLAIIVLPALAAAAHAADADLLPRFREHVSTTESIDAKARDMIIETINNAGADPDLEGILIEALVLMSPQFREGLDAYDADDYAASAAAMDALANVDDPWLRYNAAAYAVKSRVQADRLVEAKQRIADLQQNWDELAAHTVYAPELFYMLGYCQLHTMEYDAAHETLNTFLERYADAPQYLVVTARQMLAEIKQRKPESIGEVADLMTYSEKRLRAGDPGDEVQTAQDRIVELLDGMIEQAEQAEQQAQQNAAQQQQQRQQEREQRQQRLEEELRRQQNQATSPPEDSRTNEGRYRPGDVAPGRTVNPGEAWGAMPDAERDEILQVLRDSFPGRYRELVEQYYQSLAEE